jgi:hypothetical protein
LLAAHAEAPATSVQFFLIDKYLPIWKVHATFLSGKYLPRRLVMAMSNFVNPDDAATALTEVRRRQQQVIDSATVPVWYWCVVAAAMVAIGAAVDSRSYLVLGVTIPSAVVVLVVLTGAMIFGVPGRARVVGNDLLGPRGALAIVGYVWLIVGLTLGVAFALRAAGAAAPATIATVIGGVAMVATGPFLSRWLRRTMLANRAGVGE